MPEHIAKKLAELHSSYGIYPKELLNSDSKYNIINEIKECKDFNYLSEFYKIYVKHYCDCSKFQDYHKIDEREAKGTDLPYIGKNAIETGRPKLFFVFEGSLTDHSQINEDTKLEDTKLSITVLSNLWSINAKEIKEKFIKIWWKDRPDYYESIFLKLNINSKIASNCYVTDAKRIGDIKEGDKIIKNRQHLNRQLIYEEIELLKPQLVICVGDKAKNIVGMKYLDQNTKFHAVRFPKYIPKEKKDVVDKSYNELSEIMNFIVN